jgi:hypothetical protein
MASEIDPPSGIVAHPRKQVPDPTKWENLLGGKRNQFVGAFAKRRSVTAKLMKDTAKVQGHAQRIGV